MRKNLLQFLFGESQVDDEISSLVEEIADMDTDGADERLKVEKQPLEKALDALDIDTEGLEHDPRGLSLVFSDGDAYRAAHAILSQFDNMHKLAELGWVFSTQGDVASANEPAQFRIRFLEIDDVEQNNEEPKPTKGTAKNTKISAVIKKGQEFASTPMDHDDEMNPVEFDDKTSSNRHKGMSKEKDGGKAEGSWEGGKVKGAQGESMEPESKKKKGVGKEKEGAAPAGTPKGSTDGSAVDRESRPKTGGLTAPKDGEAAPSAIKEGKHKSGCQCGFCKNKGNIHLRNKPKEDDGGMDSETTEDNSDFKTEGLSPEEIVDRILEMNPGNVGTPPGIMGHKSYPTMKVPKSYPDRKFSPAKGMVQPDSAIVNQQSKRKVKSV